MRVCQYYTTAEERSADLSRRAPRYARVGLVFQNHVVPVSHMVSPSDTSVGVTLATNAIEWMESRSAWAKLRDWAGEQPTATITLGEVCLGPPVLRPSALLCFDTFEQHARKVRALQRLELEPAWYEKPGYYSGNTTTLFGHQQRVPFPRHEQELDFELQLACIVGKHCRNVSAESAAECIAGYCILNGWTARQTQTTGIRTGAGPSQGQAHATSLGPVLVTADEVPHVSELTMRAYVNGELWGEGHSGTAHFTFPQLISAASMCRTLHPGDIIASGAVGGGCGLEAGKFLKPGDVVRLEIDPLGTLENEVYVE